MGRRQKERGGERGSRNREGLREAEKRGRWKIRLKYAAGIGALLSTVLLALFLPGWYYSWKETETLEEVALERREGIRLLDMETLDIGMKLAMLGESEDFSFRFAVGDFYGVKLEDTGLVLTGEQKEFYAKRISEWEDRRLIPAGIADLFFQDDVEFYYIDAFIQIDDGVIPVRVLLSIGRNPHEMMLAAILDQSNDFLYYVASVSDLTYQYIMGCLGITSLDDLQEEIKEGSYTLDQIRDFGWYDYAGACGADGQKLAASDFSRIFQNVLLNYEDFDAYAFRSLYESDAGTGIQTMFGTSRWPMVAMTAMSLFWDVNMYSYNAWQWLDEWNNMVLEYGRDDLVRTEVPEELLEPGIGQDGYSDELAAEYDTRMKMYDKMYGSGETPGNAAAIGAEASDGGMELETEEAMQEKVVGQ